MTDAFTMLDEDLIDDCCDILGVEADATLEEIRAAFRHQAKLLHPDRNRSATATDDFIRLGEAYRILREATPRRAFDDRASDNRVESAPVVVPPRPRWRAAGAVVVAFVISVGAASTFAYLGLRGGPAQVAAPRVAETVGAPREPTLGQNARVAATAAVEQAVPPKAVISANRISDVPVSDADALDADAFEALAAAPVEVARAVSTPSTPGPEDDETLVASVVDSMDAPLADPQTKAPSQAPPRVPRVAAPPRVAHRVVLAAKLVPALVAKPIVPRQRTVAPRLVRASPWRPYPVRAAIYARYARIPVRRATARRYQAQQWQAAPTDWPF